VVSLNSCIKAGNPLQSILVNDSHFWGGKFANICHPCICGLVSSNPENLLPWGWEGRRGLAASLGSSGAAGGKARDDMYTGYTLWTLVNVYITNWKIRPPFWGNQLFLWQW